MRVPNRKFFDLPRDFHALAPIKVCRDRVVREAQPAIRKQTNAGKHNRHELPIHTFLRNRLRSYAPQASDQNQLKVLVLYTRQGETNHKAKRWFRLAPHSPRVNEPFETKETCQSQA